MVVRTSQQGVKRIPRSEFSLKKKENELGHTTGFTLKFLGKAKAYNADHALKLIISHDGTWQTFRAGKLKDQKKEFSIDLANRIEGALQARIVLVDEQSDLKLFSAGSEEIDFNDAEEKNRKARNFRCASRRNYGQQIVGHPN